MCVTQIMRKAMRPLARKSRSVYFVHVDQSAGGARKRRYHWLRIMRPNFQHFSSDAPHKPWPTLHWLQLTRKKSRNNHTAVMYVHDAAIWQYGCRSRIFAIVLLSINIWRHGLDRALLDDWSCMILSETSSVYSSLHCFHWARNLFLVAMAFGRLSILRLVALAAERRQQ